MPASQHPVFKQPPDPSIAIWRYMDFTKFVSMLETNCLFFSRADHLGDPFEGSFSKGNELLRPIVYKELYDQIEPAMVTQINVNKAELAKWQRQWTFINCWHMNPAESAAMWKLYAKSNEAIAIKSSYFRLANAVDEHTYVGTVEYIDFEHDWLPEGNTFYPFVHKRLSFAHEREVRALITQFPTSDQGIDFKAAAPDVGLERKVDLATLIEQVYVAPTSPAWFRSLVTQVCKRYSLEKPVLQSSLDAQPFF
jgi:hypothetical protein